MIIKKGLFQLLEKEVIIRCRQQDLRLVQNVLSGAAQEYKAATGRDTVLKLDTDNFLASDT
jgi:V-type H+-transporting ATPase subunit E